MVALAGRSRVLVAGVLLGLGSALAGWPWAAQVAEAWASKAPPPSLTAFWIACFVLAAAAVGAGALGADRRTLGAGALAGATAAGLGSWLGLHGPLALWSQWSVWALVHEGVVGRAPLTVALADTLSWTVLATLAASWAALVGGAILGGLGAWLRGISERASLPPGPRPAWLIAPPALLLGTWSSGFVGLVAIHQVVPAIEAVPGADQVVPVNRLVLLDHAVLTALVAGFVAFQCAALARRSQRGWRVAAVLCALTLPLLWAAPWTHTWFAPTMGWLRQWPLYALAPFLGTAVGLGAAWFTRPAWRQPTLAELAEEALLTSLLLALLLAGPGLMTAGSALSAGVAPLVSHLDTGLGTVPEIDPLPAFAIAPRLLLASLVSGVAIALLPGLPLRWLLGPPRDQPPER